MSPFPRPSLELMEQVARDPRFRALTTIPLLAPPTALVLLAAYLLYGTSIALYFAGAPYLLVLPLGAIAVYWSFTPLHDSVHRAVSRHPGLNDVVGFLGCFLLLPGITARVYRFLHLEHHRNTGDADRDPDERFVSWSGWRFVYSLTLVDVIWTAWYVRRWSSRPRTERFEFAAGLTFYLSLHIAFLLSPYATEFLLLFVLPQRLGLFITAYLFAHIQHPEGVLQSEHPFQSTVMITESPGMRLLMLGQNQHLMHHLYPSVPFYRYDRVYRTGREIFEAQSLVRRGLFRAAQPNLAQPRPQQLTARVLSVQEAGLHIRRYELVPEPGHSFPSFSAGSHIDVRLTDEIVRQYSLINDPADRDRYVIAVKRELDGRGGSQMMHDIVQPGAILTLGAPRNLFPVDLDAQHTVLLGGGIGLTPLVSMAHALRRAGRSFALHVCARSTQDMPLQAELDAAGIPYQFHPDDADRLDPATVLMPYTPGRRLMLCGPTGFMAWVLEAGRALDWPDHAMRTESFSQIDPGAHAKPFEVQLARSGTTLYIPADRSILDVMREAKVGVPSNCTRGICGACQCRVLAGTPDHRDVFLVPEEHAKNETMLVCVSRARGDAPLVLDV